VTATSPEAFQFNERSEGISEPGRLSNPAGDCLAVFGRTPAGLYTYAVYQWDLSEQAHLGGGFWSCRDLGGTYGDERSAEREAQRIVAAYGLHGGEFDGSMIDPDDV